ncbi:hypothetical protein MW887_000013 [Aspergillus wentii]|nr:hypothetical protein MW887_000013 [Aspergillus wentii]
MSCHICSRSPDPRLPFYCPTCARTELYQLRIENARVLLEKESAGQQIGNAAAYGHIQAAHFKPSSVPLGQKEQNDDDATTRRRWAIQTFTSRQAESSAKTRVMADKIKILRSKIKDKRLEISQRKLTLARRYSDAESARYQLAERETALLTGIQNNIKRTDHLWHSLHNKTAESRIFLCREAANIYGLRQKIRKKDDELKETFLIGDVPVLDLRDMNGKSYLLLSCSTPTQISTSLSNIAYLLVLISHYLSLRLPAEITLPHRNYPTPTIYAPSGSYLSREFELRASPFQSLSSSPSASRAGDSRSYFPRPRPLCIDKNLPKLAREDSGTYALFLEGVTLLAWNVSWLCRTQGLNLASDSWEEVCDIGKNMWQLLVAPPAQASTFMKAFAGRDIQSKIKAAKDPPKTIIQRTKSFPMLGHYSHGTVHSFLGASEGTDFMRTWRLPTPTKIVDKLKSTLLGEMASAEWELLEKREWDDESQEPPPSPIRETSELGPNNNNSNHTTITKTRAPERDTSLGPEALNERTSTSRLKGTSGWTKLRSR